ncbi:MAG: MmgE/PrpD family protein [Alphaproteobacteria bacterium]
MADETAEVARFAAHWRGNDAPEPVRRRVRLLLLDALGSAVRARAEAESTPSIVAAARAAFGSGTARVVADPGGYAPAAAAMVNGALIHSLDFDDTHARSSLHCGAAVIPAALAAAELTPVPMDRLLTAIAVGFEVQIRLGLAVDPRAHYARGFHPTATCGVFGAAAAAGIVLGLDPAAQDSAFGAALSQAAGSLQFLENGAWTKRFQVGWAAGAGLVAALLAREGFMGPSAAFEGRFGFLAAYSPSAQPAALLAGLGRDWETLEIAVKPYPCCRYIHPALDALAVLRGRLGIADGGDVDAVEVGLPEPAMRLIAEPAEAKRSPRSVVDGQFSMPFCGAVMLSRSAMGWDDYARWLGNPDIDRLARRFTCAVDPEVDSLPQNFAARVTVRRGTTAATELVTVPKGEPANFLTDDELRAKFARLAEPVLGPARTAGLAAAVLDAAGTAPLALTA